MLSNEIEGPFLEERITISDEIPDDIGYKPISVEYVLSLNHLLLLINY
jgi:hypothetical protein